MKGLIALDQSLCSDTALQAVLTHRWQKGDSLRVITVLDLFETLPDFSFNEAQARKSNEELVTKAAARLRERFPDLEIEISNSVLDGHPQETIRLECHRWQPDVLIMGAHGRRRISSLLLGSVSGSLLLHAPCSVMIIKNNDLSTNSRYRNVLIALDDSAHSEYALNRVINTAWSEDVRFKIFTVAEDIKDHFLFDYRDPDFSSLMKSRYAERESNCRAFAQESSKKLANVFGDDRVEWEVVVGRAREQIIRQAEQLPAGLVILGSHGRGFIDSLVLGSVSQAVALQAQCSVEIVRIPDWVKSSRSEKQQGSEIEYETTRS